VSSCLAEDRDIIQRFPTAFLSSPKFPEEPTSIIGRRLRLVARSKIKRAIKARDTSTSRVVADLRKQLDTTIFRLLVTAQSSDQFDDLRSELFPRFVELTNTISTLVPIPEGNPTEIVDQVFAALAQQLAEDNWLLPRFDGAKEEAQFCLETLHRAHFLAQDVRVGLKNGTLPPESRDDYANAVSQEWWSLLHLRCLAFAIRHKISPSDAAFGAIMNGFRNSVMAYAAARKAIEPRYSADYETIDFLSLTPHEGDYAPH